jgi:glycosyltransferase involved in cell wall biosynthesis
MMTHIENVFAEIAGHDVLLMPSLAEGTPYAMIESMACSRPVMGTPVGGIPELIEEGKTGWLARTVAVADVSDALERCWQDRPRWADMGAAAREFVISNLDQENVHAALLDQLAEDA